MNTEGAKNWPLLLGKYLVGQGAVQFLNLSAGLILLRLLSLDQYALYTMANVLLGMAIIISDLGLGQAALALGARLREDRVGLGRLMATVLKYRRTFFFGATALVCVMAPFMSSKHHWSLLEVILLLMLVALSTWFYLSVSLKTAVFNIHHDANGQNKPAFIAALLRLGLTVLGAYFLPFAVIALLANLLALMLNLHLLKKQVARYVDVDAQPDPAIKEDIKRFVYPLVPGTAYYAVQGQISTFLVSVFGSVIALAQVGALGRLTQILSLMSMVNGFFTLPYFARLSNKEIFIRRSIALLGGAAALLGLMLLSAYLVPHYWLLILGHAYMNLTRELPLAVAAAMLNFIAGLMYTLLLSRAETAGQHFGIYVNLLIQIFVVLVIGVNTAYDAFVLNLLMALGALLVNAVLLTRMIARKTEWDPSAPGKLAPNT